MEVTGTGIVEIENQTTDNNTTLTVAGNGAGTPTLNLKNSTKEVRLTCETDDELYVRGPTSGERFTFAASSSTGGITWPDGTEQITAATASTGPSIGGQQSYQTKWSGQTQAWFCVNEANVGWNASLNLGDTHYWNNIGNQVVHYIPIYFPKAKTIDYISHHNPT